MPDSHNKMNLLCCGGEPFKPHCSDLLLLWRWEYCHRGLWATRDFSHGDSK